MYIDLTMEEEIKVLQNLYATKRLDFQRNVFECKSLFAQFSKQLQDSCLAFEIEIEGGELPPPNIPWFSYDFQHDLTSDQPILKQISGRLCSSKLINAEENDKEQEGQADENRAEDEVKNVPHPKSISYLTAKSTQTTPWRRSETQETRRHIITSIEEKTDARNNSQTSRHHNATDYDADVSCGSGVQSRLSAFSVAESDTTINPQSSFQTTYYDSSSYVIRSLSQQLYERSRYEDTVSECYASDAEIIEKMPKRKTSCEKASFLSVSILAQVDDTLLSCYKTNKSVELDQEETKHVAQNIDTPRTEDEESDSFQLNMDRIVYSNSMQSASLKEINDESPCSENVSINTVSSINGSRENEEQLVNANLNTPVKEIDDERTVVKDEFSNQDSISSINHSRNKTLNDSKAEGVFLDTPCRPAAARLASSKLDPSLQHQPAQVYKDATEELFKDESCEPVVKRKRRRGKHPLNMPRNRKTRRGSDFMKLYVSKPNLQSYLYVSYTRREPTSVNLKLVRDTIVCLGICNKKEALIMREMSARTRSPLFSSIEDMNSGDKVVTTREGTHDDVPNGFVVIESASYSPEPSAVSQTGHKDIVTSLGDIAENGNCVDDVVITDPFTNDKNEMSKSSAAEAWEALGKTAESRKKATEPSPKVTEPQENTLFEDPLFVKRRLRTRQVAPLHRGKDTERNSALHIATEIFKGEESSSSECKPRSSRNMRKKCDSNVKESKKIAVLIHSEYPKEELDQHSLIQPLDVPLKQSVEMQIDTNDDTSFMLKETVSMEEPCNSQQLIANSCPDVNKHEEKGQGVLKEKALRVSAVRSTKRSQRKKDANEIKEGCVAERWSLRISKRNNSKELREPENSAKALVLTKKNKFGNGNQKGGSNQNFRKRQDRCVGEESNKDHIHKNDSSVESLQMTTSKSRVCGKRNQFEASKTNVKKGRRITSRAGTNNNDVDSCFVAAVTADSLNIAGCYVMKVDTVVDAENTTISVDSSCSLHLTNNAENKDTTDIPNQGSNLGEKLFANDKEHNKEYSLFDNRSSMMGNDLVCKVDLPVSPSLITTSTVGDGSENKVIEVNSSVNGIEKELQSQRNVLDCQRRRTVSVAPKLIFIEEDDEAIKQSRCLETEKEDNGIWVVRDSLNVKDLDKSTAPNDSRSKTLDAPGREVAIKKSRKRRNNTKRAAAVAKKVSKIRDGLANDADLTNEQAIISRQKNIHQIKAVATSSKKNEKSEVNSQEKDTSAMDFSNVTREENKSTDKAGATKVCNSKISKGQVKNAKKLGRKNRRRRGKDDTDTNFKENDITPETKLQKPHSCDLTKTVNSTKARRISSLSFKKDGQLESPTGKSPGITGRSSSTASGDRITPENSETTFKKPVTRQSALKNKSAKKRGSSNSTDATVLREKKKRTLFSKKNSSLMSLGFSMLQDSAVNVTRDSVIRSNTSVMPQTLSNFLQSFVAPKVKKKST